MKLSPRLQCIADMIHKNSYVADIGTDHAYIPIYLIKNNICSRAIATDIRTGPVSRAERNIKIYGLQNQIEVRRGYGLSPLHEGEVECAILTGMGGYLICDILDNDKEKADTIEYFIIQPMQVPEAIRLYLYKNDYKICDEMLVKDNGKINQIIAVQHGTDYIDDEIYFEIGKKIIERKDPLLEELIYNKINELNKVLHKIQNKYTANAQKRIEECKNKLDKYEEVLKCI